MQTMFRLMPEFSPWNQNGAMDQANGASFAAAQSPLPFVSDLPSSAGNATKGKRKRAADSPTATGASFVKKAKGTMDALPGAGQLAPERPRSTDVPNIAPKPVSVYQQPYATWKSSGLSGVGPWLSNPPYDARHVQVKSPVSYNHAAPRVQTPQMPRAQVGTNLSASGIAVAPATNIYEQFVARQAPRATPTFHAHATQQAGMSVAKPTVPSPATSSVPTIVAPVHSPEKLNLEPTSKELNSSRITPKSNMNLNKDALRAVIEAEINQAILYKHNELRLIEQELAKCQTAMEQIRRCSIVPYPGSNGPSLDVSAHSGPALVTPAGLSPPEFPAPYGVTDGPYTKHYASWLIPSPIFDPHVVEPLATPTLPKDGRATRGSFIETPQSAYPSRSARASLGRSRVSIDAQTSSTVRDPLIIKRHQDGQWVKLYCSECNPERSDFANVQGFLNHCRISHKKDYKSHEAAAIACGRVVSSENAPAAEPVSARETVSKISFSAPSERLAVHPLNKSTVISNTAPIVPRMPVAKDTVKVMGLTTPVTPTVSTSFKESSLTPNLSNLLRRRGFNEDFSARVKQAMDKVDLSVYEDSDSEPEGPPQKKAKTGKQKSSEEVQAKASNARRMPALGPPNPAPASPLAQSTTSSALPTPAANLDVEMDLSPHTVADSNPGLVSDRDEDEDDLDDDVPSSRNSPRAVEPEIVEIEDGDERVMEQQTYCTQPPQV